MTPPKNWLSPSARQELRTLRDELERRKFDGVRAELEWRMLTASHAAVPQLLDEVERLEAVNRELENAWNSASKQRDELRAERDKAWTDNSDLRAVIDNHMCEAKLVELKRELDQAQLNSDALKKDLEVAAAQAREYGKRSSKDFKAIAKLTAERTYLEQELAAAKQELEKLRGQYSAACWDRQCMAESRDKSETERDALEIALQESQAEVERLEVELSCAYPAASMSAEYQKLRTERDALKAEVERLKPDAASWREMQEGLRREPTR